MFFHSALKKPDEWRYEMSTKPLIYSNAQAFIAGVEYKNKLSNGGFAFYFPNNKTLVYTRCHHNALNHT